MEQGVLSGVKVIEVADMVAAPYCAKILADLGAEVVKVEPPQGDTARHYSFFVEEGVDPEKSALFLYLNTNKLGITLNLERDRGRQILYDLIKGADILVLDKQPAQREELGLARDKLLSVNPQLIIVAITPFGQTGPYRDYKTYHLNRYQAGGDGHLIATTPDFLDRPPLQAPALLGDYQSGLGSAIATLAALYFRNLTGIGQEIDCSEQEWCLGLNAMYLGKYPNDGTALHRKDMIYSLGGIMPCKDGYVMLMLLEERHWDRLIELMDDNGWAQEERFRTQYSRNLHGKEANKRITEFLLKHTKAELNRLALEKGIPIGPVVAPHEVLDSEQAKARGFFVDIDHPVAGCLPYPVATYRFAFTLGRRPAPLLGQHNTDVLSSLSYSEEELARLKQEGII